MPQLIVTDDAVAGIDRCIRFLAERNEAAAGKALLTISEKLNLLRRHPAIGRPVPGEPGRRELVIAFGKGGYVALYSHQPDDDAVYVLALRHQREAHY